MRPSKITLLSLLPLPTPLYAAVLVIAKSRFQCGSKRVIPVTRTITIHFFSEALFQPQYLSWTRILIHGHTCSPDTLRANRIMTKDSPTRLVNRLRNRGVWKMNLVLTAGHPPEAIEPQSFVFLLCCHKLLCRPFSLTQGPA